MIAQTTTTPPIPVVTQTTTPQVLISNVTTLPNILQTTTTPVRTITGVTQGGSNTGNPGNSTVLTFSTLNEDHVTEDHADG